MITLSVLYSIIVLYRIFSWAPWPTCAHHETAPGRRNGAHRNVGDVQISKFYLQLKKEKFCWHFSSLIVDLLIVTNRSHFINILIFCFVPTFYKFSSVWRNILLFEVATIRDLKTGGKPPITREITHFQPNLCKNGRF